MTITGAIHKLIVLVAVFTAANTSYAQTYINTPQDTLTDTLPLESGKVLDFTQQAINADTLHLAWEKISESLPTGWIAFLCDYGTCYTTLPTAGAMYPIPPSDYGLLSLHIEAHTTFGTAVIRYAVWDVNNPNERDTLTWIAISNATGVQKIENRPYSMIYSFKKNLYIQNPERNKIAMEIYDLSGKKQLQYSFSKPDEVIDLAFLTEGLYLIRVWEGEKYWVHKIYIGNR